MTLKFFSLLITLLIAQHLCAQRDTLLFLNFEFVRRGVNANNVVTTVTNGAVFRDAAPFLLSGGTVSHGSPYRSGHYLNQDQFSLGKTFIYHSPTWHRTSYRGPRFEGVSFNHIELKLPETLKANRVYLLSFLTVNFANFKYKPSAYGIKFSEERIIKNKRGGLLTDPDVMFPFTADREIVQIQSVFTSDHDINFLYFGCFAEDSLVVPKTYIQLEDTIQRPWEINDSLITRVLLDNILIEELHKDDRQFGDVYFDVDIDEVTNPEDQDVIASLATYMKLNQHRLLLQGYTDKTGSLAYNMELSRRRADNIKRIIVESGIDEDRIITLGKGKNVSKTGKDMKYDRRVSFLLYK